MLLSRLIRSFAVVFFVVISSSVWLFASGNAAALTQSDKTNSYALPETTTTPMPNIGTTVISADNITQLTQVARLGNGTLNGALWLNDGTHFLTYGSLGIAIFDKSDLNTPVRFMTTDFGTYRAVLSPDGKVLASAGGDGILRGINIDTSEIVFEYSLSDFPLYDIDMDFDMSGQYFAVANNEEGANIIDLTQERIVWTTEEDVDAVEFSADGNLLAIAYGSNQEGNAGDTLIQRIDILEVGSNTVVHELLASNRGIQSMAFSDDGQWLYVTDWRGLEYWNLQDENQAEPVGTMDMEEDIDTLTLFNGQLWGLRSIINVPLVTIDIENATITEKFTLPDEVTRRDILDQRKMDFNESGEIILLVEGKLWLYNTQTGAYTVTENAPQESFGYWRTEVDVAGNILIANLNAIMVQYYDTTELIPFFERDIFISRMKIIPNTSILALELFDAENIAGEGQLELWDIETRELIQTIEDFEGSLLAFRDAQSFFVNRDGSLVLFELATDVTSKSIRVDNVNEFAVNPVYSVLAFSASDSSSIALYDYAQAISLQELHGHTLRIETLAFSPDGRFLVSADEESIILWDTNTWAEAAHIPNSGGYSIAISPDSTLAVVLTMEGLTVIDMNAAEIIHTFSADHNTLTMAFAFTHDGTMLATTGIDGTLRLWGIPTE